MEKPKNKNSQLSNYAKYSGLVFQMFATIGLAVWGGMKLDERLRLKFPAFSVTFACLAVVGSLILLIRSLPKE